MKRKMILMIMIAALIVGSSQKMAGQTDSAIDIPFECGCSDEATGEAADFAITAEADENWYEILFFQDYMELRDYLANSMMYYAVQDNTRVDCEDVRKHMTDTLKPIIFEIENLQDTVITALIEKVDAKKLSQLSKNKSDKELCNYYKESLEKLKKKITKRATTDKNGESVEYFSLRTVIADSFIPLKRIRCVGGKLFIDKVDMSNHSNGFKTDFSVEIEGKFLTMSSTMMTIGKTTGYRVRIADISLAKEVGSKYILKNSANQVLEYNTLDEIIDATLPKECWKYTH